MEHWTTSMETRLNETIREQRGITLPRSRHIILDDVRSFNFAVQSSLEIEEAAPESPRHDRLRVELLPAHTTPSKQDHLAAKPPKSKKRKRGMLAEAVAQQSELDENDEWRVLANGKEMVKRVGNALVRKPVESVDDQGD